MHLATQTSSGRYSSKYQNVELAEFPNYR